MGYHDAALNPQVHQTDRFANRDRDLIVQSIHDILDRQLYLLSEDAGRVAQRITINNAQVVAEIEALEQ